jgi:hypothetical protein
MLLKVVRGGRLAMLVTLVQVLPWSMVLKICPLLLTVQMTPRLALDMENSVIEGAIGAPLPPCCASGCASAPGGVGFGCGGCGGGGGSGCAVPQATWGLSLSVVRSGLAAVKEWAPSRVIKRHW